MPFQALDPGLTRSARMEEYGLISGLVTTPNLKAVVRKALAREPKDRFQTALEFMVALRSALRSATEDSDSWQKGLVKPGTPAYLSGCLVILVHHVFTPTAIRGRHELFCGDRATTSEAGVVC